MNQHRDPVPMASKAFVLCLSYMLGWFGMAGIGRAQTEQSPVEEQRAIRWSRHVETLLDVAVHTDNDPKFLNWAEQYCDSLESLEEFTHLAGEFRARIHRTLDIVQDDLNHRVPTLEFFRGIPGYMGFADDAADYAVESAMSALLAKPVEFQSFTQVQNGALHAVVIQNKVDRDFWEVVLHALDVETNHTFHRVLGVPEGGADSLIWAVQQSPSQANVSALAATLEVSRVALFDVELIDDVEGRLKVVGMTFQVWDTESGFGDVVMSKGFCQDMTTTPIFWNLIDLLCWSFLLLTFISGLERLSWQNIKRFRGIELLLVPLVWFYWSIRGVWRTLLFLIIPVVVSFLFITAVAAFVPDATTHSQEIAAKLWVMGMAIGMSLVPTILNFFILNRFRLDGFHGVPSYRDLTNVSLVGSYVPFMVFHEMIGAPLGAEFIVALVVAAWMAADLLAFNFHEFLTNRKSLRVRLTSALGLMVGVVVVIVLTTDMLGEASLRTSLELSLLGGLANLAFRPAMQWAHRKDRSVREATSTDTKLESGQYVQSVFPMLEDAIVQIESIEFGAGYVAGPRGIGKTRLTEEIQSRLEASGWLVFYGDCDEVQDEGHLAFEPFVEAFGEFLGIQEVGDRTAEMDALAQSAMSTVAEGGLPVGMKGVDRDASRIIEEFAQLLVDKLNKMDKKVLVVFDDVHWMNSETQQLLEVFWNLAAKLKPRLKVLLTFRTDGDEAGRRLLKDQFDALTSYMEADDLLAERDFEVANFLKGLSDLRPDFTMSKDSLTKLNDLFNERLRLDAEDQDQVVTPLYIIRTIFHFQSNQTLQPGSDGWVLTRSVALDDLPNAEAIDAYYHGIFKKHDGKWMRVLESASIVGRNFDATVLAEVWGLELLDVLDFLEQLESEGILVDVREEDNVYRFKDKRAIAAVRSYFPNASGDRNARQIVIEYNKRLQKLGVKRS